MTHDIPIHDLDTLQGVLDLLSDRIPVTEDELVEAQQALNDLHHWCQNESDANTELHDKWREAVDRLHAAWHDIEAMETLMPSAQ